MDVFQSVYIPKQTSRKAFELESMGAILTSFPPLSQITTVEGTTVTIVLMLQLEKSRASDTWEVSVRHSSEVEWKDSPCQSLEGVAAELPSVIETANEHAHNYLYFTTTVDIVSPMKFTARFRNAADQAWTWVKDHQGILDGTVLSKSMISESRTEDLHELISGLNHKFEVKKVLSQSPDTFVWSVTAPIEAAIEDKSAMIDVKFGLPWDGVILRWFALIRIWSPWLAPRQGNNPFSLDKEAVLCSFMHSDGRHLVLLAISGIQDVMALFRSDKDGNVILNIRNDRNKAGIARVVVGLGNDFESANAAAMYHARNIVHDAEQANGEEQKEMQAVKDGVNIQWMENWFDGLTYCTWNGLGQRLTDEKVFNAVDTLAAHNINITNLIIDDNWQSIDYRGNGQFQHGWIEFEADRKAFPQGLKSTISRIRNKHKHIQHIAVWHAILGYWAGLSPDGKIANNYKTAEVVRVDSLRRNLPMGGKMTVVAKEDIFRMYDDFYRFLSDCGVDAVKTDAQFMLDTFKSAKDRCDLFTTYLDAWTISSLRHFSIKAISCMSQTPQILFHSQLPQNKPAILVRNSDDFFPDVESSHPWHIFVNAHNSLLTQHLNLLPDWDMFQTVHSYSGFHAAARCVSGGPIYITDVPGQHNISLINQMTGQNTRGRTVIFRPNVGKSLDAYTGYDDEVLLKIGTYHGQAATGTSIIGLFNISPRPLTELIHLSRFLSILHTQPYIIRSHVTSLITPPLHVTSPTALLATTLAPRGYDILSAFPLRAFQNLPVPTSYPATPSSRSSAATTTWIANLGLLGKMTGAAAIVSSAMSMDPANHKITIDTSLKALGVLGIYISSLPLLPRRDGESFPASHLLITIHGHVIPAHAVSIAEDGGVHGKGKVLAIDVERAWREMGEDAGWGNEVAVRIYIHPLKEDSGEA